jgi:hypothetical protein
MSIGASQSETGPDAKLEVRSEMQSHWRGLLAALVVAIGLTFVFWLPLYQGAGFVGGDVYSYYMPQKDLLSQHIQAGEFPMWHHRTGWGYPLIAESQTGLLYPVTWVCYRVLDVNAAYNANHIVHYILAFVFLWLYGRRLGLKTVPAMLAAVVYVYGWFPPRASLEWTIIGGTWLPAALWVSESFLQTKSKRWLITLAAVLAMQLLAGHFALAFITLLALGLYVPMRIWLTWEKQVSTSERMKMASWFVVPVVAAFLLAAVQLVPTWELKTNSQRAQVTEEHNPAYGHMPPMYISQLVASWWWWYAEDVDTNKAIQNMKFLASDAGTNQVEAHLYFGLIPLGLLVIALFSGRVFTGRAERVWGVLGVLFLSYTPGWFIPITQHLPGFSFFHGPGRYSIITAIAAGIVAASVVNSFCERRKLIGNVLCLLIIAATVAEFRVVGRQVSDAVMIESPPIARQPESSVRKYFAGREDQVRLYAPGQNLPNLCGVAAMPVYLGLSPDEYFNTDLTVPIEEPVNTPRKLDWLLTAGVTHVLAQAPVESERLTQVLREPDIFLNRAWGRPSDLPFYLYELVGARPRAYSDNGSVEVEELTSNTVVLAADMDKPGRVILTDLMAPGWSVEVDGKPATPIAKPDKPTTPIEVFRAVDVEAGKHRIVWHYAPNSVYIGGAISGVSWLLLCLLALVRRPSPQPN